MLVQVQHNVTCRKSAAVEDLPVLERFLLNAQLVSDHFGKFSDKAMVREG